MKVSERPNVSPNNLPTPISSFIGRGREIVEVKELLFSHRLVTLTGPGGSGKTRLALKAAERLSGEFQDGIWFIEFSSVVDPIVVPQTIATACGIREQAGKTILDLLLDFLSSRQSLLILDNCEHLISACAQFSESSLRKSPGLKILVTSREVLGITGEAAWMVPALSLPDQQPWVNPASAQDALSLYEASESVQLFVTRAMAISPEFELTADNGPWVAEICRRLDGMPLAIELAAARVRSLSVQQIAQRLDDRFQLLTGGSRTAPLRQQTLLSTLDWSYALLSEKEQKVLQRLAVFAGGATLDAAEKVCGGGADSSEVLDALSHLVDKSLIKADTSERGESRYRLLETIRQYASEKLQAAGALEESRNAHLEYFLGWAETAEPLLGDVQQLAWLKSYEAEHDNLRAALEWCNADSRHARDGLRLATACAQFWRLRGYLSEGRTRILDALSHAANDERTETRARALFWSASLAYLQSDYPATRLHAEESLALWRELKDAGVGLADTLDLLGELATEEGNYSIAPAFFKEALQIFRELKDLNGIGDMLMQLGWAYMRIGQYESAAAHMSEVLTLFREAGHTSFLGFTLSGLGELAIRQGQFERATEFLEESLTIRRQHGHRWGIGASLGSLGWVALLQHDYASMRASLRESLAIRTEIGDRGGTAWCLEKLAEAKYEEAQFAEAARIFGHAQALRTPIGSVIDPVDQPNYARLISGLQSALGMDAFALAWAEGASAQLDDVIELALSESAHSSTSTDKEKFGGLTAREREVAVLIAQGKSNREIAQVMTVGIKTIETYVTRILNKLGFDSRVQIALWAVEKELR